MLFGLQFRQMFHAKGCCSGGKVLSIAYMIWQCYCGELLSRFLSEWNCWTVFWSGRTRLQQNQELERALDYQDRSCK